jgi:hypothetical protein
MMRKCRRADGMIENDEVHLLLDGLGLDGA